MSASTIESAIDTLLTEGDGLMEQKEFAQADEVWSRALKNAERAGYTNGMAGAHQRLSRLRRQQSDYHQSIAHGKLAIKLAKAEKNKPLLLRSLIEVAQSFQMLRQYANTARYYKSALLLANKLKDNRALINLHCFMAWLCQSTGKMKTAFEHAHQSVLLVPVVNEPYWTAAANMGMGNLCSQTGNDDLAIEYHLRSLAVMEQTGLNQHVASALDNISETFGKRDQWQKAEEYKLRAFALRQQGANKYILLHTHLSMARLYVNTLRFVTAEQHLAAAEALAKEFFPESMYHVYTERAEACKRMEQWQQAIEFDQLFLQNRTLANDKIEMAAAHHRMGECYTAVGKYAAAKKHLQTALQLAVKQKAFTQLEKTEHALSALAKIQGRHEDALLHLQKYNSYREQRINLASEYRIVLLQMQYESKRKDEEIEVLKKQLQQTDSSKGQRQYGLSPRELTALKLLMAGKSFKAMATEMKVSYETIRTYIKRLYAKLGVLTNTEAVNKATKENLVD